MTPEQSVAHMRQHLEKLVQLHEVASREYASRDDALANFKRRAKEAGITPFQAWHVLTGKHWDGISAWVRGNRRQRETIGQRVYDSLVYLLLLLNLIEDGKAPAVTLHDVQSPESLEELIKQYGETEVVRMINASMRVPTRLRAMVRAEPYLVSQELVDDDRQAEKARHLKKNGKPDRRFKQRKVDKSRRRA